MKALTVHSRWQAAALAGTDRALAPAPATVSAEATSGAVAECRTVSRLDPRSPARLRSPWLTAAIAAIGMSLAVAALGPLSYPQSLKDPWPIELLWQDGIAMQISGYVLLVLTFVGLSFSLRKRWARLRRFDYRGWRLFHGCLGVLGLAVLVLHTGMNLGVGLNRLLMLDYLGLGLAGGLMGLMIGLGGDRGPRQRAQRVIQRSFPCCSSSTSSRCTTIEAFDSKLRNWTAWAILALAATGGLYYALTRGDARLFLTGPSMSGHHQIEIACAVCHTEPFGGDAVLQSACVECHGEALNAGEDSHPKRLFTDPRNADRVAVVDARRCVACHREHRPRLTRAVGVTIADDHCFYCHADIADERPSHRGFAAEGCASAGCHNYHDNRALYEDFLVKHLNEPETLPQALLPRRNWASVERQIKKQPVRALTLAERDAPQGLTVHPRVAEDWAFTGHARGGVNCTDCHAPKSSETAERVWRDRPDESACRECHREEVEGFARGKHGMRRAQGLPPLRPADARQPMRAAAHEKTLGCVSCHKAHRFDTRHAAVGACLGCHDDAHSRAYRASPHGRLWEAERAGRDAPGSGVSCATCHMPREAQKREGLTVVRVQHNQNRNLRPNEKMVRSVCLNCHGLGFSLAALGSPRLVARNFGGRPLGHIRSLRMARARLIEANTR